MYISRNTCQTLISFLIHFRKTSKDHHAILVYMGPMYIEDRVRRSLLHTRPSAIRAPEIKESVRMDNRF